MLLTYCILTAESFLTFSVIWYRSGRQKPLPCSP